MGRPHELAHAARSLRGIEDIVRYLPVLWLAAVLHGTAHADDDAIATFKIPVPPRSYVRLEPSYTMLSDGGSSSVLLGRGLLVYDGW